MTEQSREWERVADGSPSEIGAQEGDGGEGAPLDADAVAVRAAGAVGEDLAASEAARLGVRGRLEVDDGLSALPPLEQLVDPRQGWVVADPVAAPGWLVRLALAAILMVGLLLPLAGGVSGVPLRPGGDWRRAPWPRRWDAVLGESPAVAAGIAALAVAGLFAGWAVSRAARVPLPVVGPPQEAMPARLGPAQLAFVATGRIEGHGPLIATVLQLQQLGLAAAQRDQDGTWTLQGTALVARWPVADPVCRSVGAELGLASPGGRFVLKDLQAGIKLAAASRVLDYSTLLWAYQEGVVTPNQTGQFGHALWRCAAIATSLWLLVAAVFTPFTGPSIAAVPLAGFLVGCGQHLVRRPNSLQLTAAGRVLYAQVTGYRDHLSASAAAAQPAATEPPKHWEQLPAAVALGVDASLIQTMTAHGVGVPPWHPQDPGGWAFRLLDCLDEYQKALGRMPGSI